MKPRESQWAYLPLVGEVLEAIDLCEVRGDDSGLVGLHAGGEESKEDALNEQHEGAQVIRQGPTGIPGRQVRPTRETFKDDLP